MPKDQPSPKSQGGKNASPPARAAQGSSAGREEALAAALRANLQRRKDQQRTRRRGDKAGSP